MANKQPKKSSASEVNVADIFLYLMTKWQWFLLSVIIFMSLAWFKYEKAPRVYSRTATVYIKDPANKTQSASLDRYDNFINKVNVTNEIFRFRSKDLLSEVVKRTNADVSYTVPERLHTRELYGQSPVIVSFIGENPGAASFKITLKGDDVVYVSDFSNGSKDMAVTLRDTVSAGDLRFSVFPSNYYLKTMFNEGITVTKVPVPAMVGYYQANLGINQETSEASILNLTIKDSSPIRAGEVLNMLITVYNEQSIRDKNMVAINTANFISERLAIIESELGGVESDLEDFKRSNQIVTGLGESASQYSTESRQYGSDVSDLDNQIQMAQYVKEYLVDPSKETELIPANTGINSPAIESQISQYNALRLKRSKLIADGGEANPVVQEVNSSMLSLKQNIIRAVDNYITDLGVRRNDLKGRVDRAQVRMASIPTKERQMLSIERQQKIKEQLYLFLLNRREENAISQAMADNNAQVINSPDGPSSPISPSRNRILLLGFLIGMAIPAVIFLIAMFLDTKVHTKREIREAVSVPFLGEIPLDRESIKRKKKSGEPAIPVKSDPEGIIAEAFSILRTNMNFIRHEGKPCQVITLTSFNESAGKTFVSSNLALSLAKTGKSVIIVDLDIRKATMSRIFNLNKIGITNYLADSEIKVDDLIQKDGLFGEIDLIPAGAVAPNPAELLMESRLDDLIAVLRERYDYILVDNVPVGIVADATISNRIADLTMFVGKAGVLDRRQLQDLEDIYLGKELTNLVFVFNGTSVHSLGYSHYGYGNYGYGYGYGYGKKYGYGYGDKERKNRRKSKKNL